MRFIRSLVIVIVGVIAVWFSLAAVVWSIAGS